MTFKFEKGWKTKEGWIALPPDINNKEIREKHKLIKKIKVFRNNAGLSQKDLAIKLKVTQGRVAQIESGVETKMVSFDLLFKILNILGYNYTVVLK